MRVTKSSTLVVMALLLIALAGTVWWVTRTDETRAQTVAFQVTGEAPLTLELQDALQRASAEAGFEVHVPSRLPTVGLEMTSISVDKGPKGLPNAMASVSIKWAGPDKGEAGGYYLEVLQFPVEIGAPESAPALTGTPAGMRAFIERNADGTSMITAFAGGRTYLLVNRGAPQPPEASLAATAGSLGNPK